MDRRLTAIMAADLAGYSALMERDETGTFMALGEARETILAPEIARHKGRVVKLIGDGVLAEFPSVIAATLCGVKIQDRLHEARVRTPDGSPIGFRIGINLGDVITEDGDIYGDGVNVAARVEGLTPVGDVCITRSVRDQIRDRLDLVLEDWGQISVKNLARPVRVFRVVRDAQEARAILAKQNAGRRSRSWALIAILALGAGLIATPTYQPPDQPAALPAWTIAEADGTVRITTTANIRRGPSLSHEVVTTVPAGTELEVTGAVDTGADRWLRLDMPGRDDALFVHASLAAAVQPAPESVALSQPVPPTLDQPPTSQPATVEIAPPPDAPSVVPAAAQAAVAEIWVTISLDFSSAVFTDCTHVRSAVPARLPIGRGWQRVTMSGPSELAVLARATRAGAGVQVSVWPYPDRWPETEKLSVDLSAIEPGGAGRAFTSRRAEPPFAQCGGFDAYVNVVDAPEE